MLSGMTNGEGSAPWEQRVVRVEYFRNTARAHPLGRRTGARTRQ
ncbi:hypothetical protein STRIP9103_06005, partial [Streptomyces ipomoeae 91-03]